MYIFWRSNLEIILIFTGYTYVHENEAKSISKTTLFFEDEVKNAASAKYYKQRSEREKIQIKQTVQFSQLLINSIILSSLLVEFLQWITIE